MQLIHDVADKARHLEMRLGAGDSGFPRHFVRDFFRYHADPKIAARAQLFLQQIVQAKDFKRVKDYFLA
jgi:hypothetical protein